MDPTQIRNPQTEIPRTTGSGRGACPDAADGELRELGRGRSGFVYLGLDDDGNKLACKVFDSHSVTKLVQVALLGSPNPYIWNEDAVRCALLRRRILHDLVEFWFGDRVKVASASGYSWNGQHNAYELFTEFSDGKPIPLHHPLRKRGEGLLEELTSEVMRPLQDHLIDAGCDGLVWQAGKGNPVALNNFLYERDGDDVRWVWIDLESGVPALVPANPLALFGFYLPRSFRYGRPLFDDVDVPRLLEYISTHEQGLAERLGDDRVSRLRENVLALQEHQAAWKSLPLHFRSIGYHLARRTITEKQADHYRRSRFRWICREIVRCSWAGIKGVGKLSKKLATILARIDWAGVPRFFGRLATSYRFRGFVARLYVGNRIRSWRKRGQLSEADARHLRDRLRNEESSAYLSDFGVHLAIKPFVKAVEYWFLPMIWGLGWIDTGTLAVSMLACGPVVRSLYTLSRMMQAVSRGREKPWVALGVGVIPVLGNFAYPMQIIYSSTEKDVAGFILYDGGAKIGSLVPIWGGKDTRTEHFFNRLPDYFANLRSRDRDIAPESG